MKYGGCNEVAAMKWSNPLVLLTVLFLAVPIQLSASPGPDIVVSPLEYDFGDVVIGSPATVIVTIQNISIYFEEELIVEHVSLTTESGDFVITMAPLPYTVLDIGESTQVEVTFTPSVEGFASAQLVIISNDAINPEWHVPLSGTGLVTKPDPSALVAEILAFFDSSVADGSLVGSGSGNSADGRRRALRNMLEASGDLIEGGYYDQACGQLNAAYAHADGLPAPPDFVTGPAAPQLAQMILDLMAALGCE